MKTKNVFDGIPENPQEELFERLVDCGQVKIERIVSTGQCSPETGWYDQEDNEWVIVLKGEAVVLFDDRSSVHLGAGDYINIPLHKRHRVEWTSPDEETVWLAVHYPS